MTRIPFFIVAGLALLASAAGAQLTRTTPAPKATVRAVATVRLEFASPIKPATAGAQIIMTGMPGMADHPPMMIKAFTIEADKDGRALTLKLRKTLVAGDYDVKWSVLSTDGKPLSGRWSFTAR